VKLTRRDLGAGAAIAALGVLIGTSGLVLPALAQPSQQDLLQAGPLGEMVLGAENAPVTIIEYASMTCGHCANFHERTFPELKKRYIDTGKARLLFREFPLDPLAAAGSMLARCAGKDRYFAIVDILFRTQKQWVVQRPLEPLMGIARQAGFTKESFEACLANQQVLDGIEWVRARGAEKFGVNSTPTFFINGKIHRGDIPIEELDKLIQP
jgi:protein-disulfide isomerase